MKRLSIIILALFLLCLPFFSYAQLTNPKVEAEKEEYEPFIFEEDILSTWGTFTEEEQQDYAGVYIDGETIVLLFKEGTNSLKNAYAKNDQNGKTLANQEKGLKQSIRIGAAAYSYNELRTVCDYLVKEAYSIEGVYSIGLCNKENCICIGILSDTPEKEIRKKLYSMIQSDTDVEMLAGYDILSFHTVYPKDEISYVTSINGNTQLNTIYSNGNGYI